MKQPLRQLTLSALLVSLSIVIGCGTGRLSPGGESAPTLLSLSADTITAGSSDFTLTVSGRDFLTSSRIRFGSEVLVPSLITADQLQVSVPAALVQQAAVIPVRAFNLSPSGGDSNALDFTILNPTPTLAGLSLTDVVAGTGDFSLTVTGTNFAPEAAVSFGTQSFHPSSRSSSQLEVVIPGWAILNSGDVSVSVTNPGPGGGVSNAQPFTVMNPAPLLSALSLDSTVVGSSDLAITISGVHLVPGAQVHFGGATLAPNAVVASGLSLLIPRNLLTTAAVLPLSVSNPGPGGGESNVLQFTVKNPIPAVNALSSSSVTAGTDDFTLTLNGDHFVPASVVDFGGQKLSPASVTPTQISVVVPAAAVAGGAALSVSVSNPGPGGGVSNSQGFTIYNPVPQLAALSLTKAVIGAEGFPLEITGSNFVPQTEINFGEVSLRPDQFSKGRLRLGVPKPAFAHGGVLLVQAISPGPGGGSSNTLEFTVEYPVPVLSGVSPISITASGSEVVLTLQGSGFTDKSTVNAAGSNLPVENATFSQMQITLPSTLTADAGMIPLTVINPQPGGGTSGTFNLIVHGRARMGWSTVANSRFTLPGTSELFNSFNQPSVTQNGVVALKGQSKGASGPVVGIFTMDMAAAGPRQLNRIADNSTVVPQPNNTSYSGGALSTFTQFPSFPRIDRDYPVVAFRAQHKPVWTFSLPDTTESRVGSAGIYTNAAGALSTGAGLFGALPEFSYLQVPGAPPATRFDQFPGSPAITGKSIIVFKGNYTVGDISKTGVFYRDAAALDGKSPVELIANSDMRIPNQPEGGNVLFGSTAPPSVADGIVVFAGYDNEDEPTLGGIYSAPLSPSPALQTVVGIGDPVPGEPDGSRFNRFGEALAFDGRFVAFWGAWGSEMKTVVLQCAADGEKDMIAACTSLYPNGYEAKVPLHQGVFVYDLSTHAITAVAKTTAEFDDFLYWVFSGRPPGVGGGGAGEDVVPEPPRWRSSSFIAASGRGGASFQVVFKARTGATDGIYLAQGPDPTPILTVVDTTMGGDVLDPEAPFGSIISTLGIERESLRNNWLVLSASMLNSLSSESGAGIYLTNLAAQ